ncbi:MAG: bacteriohemerythrin [Armatimonadota bacterium]
MPLIQWNQQFSVGVPQIDSQHATLIDMINRLHEAMSAGRGNDVLVPILNGLASYTKTHFATEERLMVAHSYPYYAAHKQVHDSFALEVAGLQAKVASGGTLLTVHIMNRLRDWLANHILKTDKLLGQFLTGQGTLEQTAGRV